MKTIPSNNLVGLKVSTKIIIPFYRWTITDLIIGDGIPKDAGVKCTIQKYDKDDNVVLLKSDNDGRICWCHNNPDYIDGLSGETDVS